MDSDVTSQFNSATEINISPPSADTENLDESTNQAIQEARQKFDALLEEGALFVKQNPGKAIAAALGVGFVLGLFVKD